jgi:enoyl-[acyl-carrier protein] reductase III
MGLEGRVALVTGASRGIGRAIALLLAARGAHIGVNFFRNRDAAEETAREIEALGVRALLLRGSVSEESHVARIFAALEETFGRCDVLISNAASGVLRPLLELEVKHWEWTMNVNARGLLLTAQRAAPLMAARGWGRIVSLSSLGANRVVDDYGVVGASKAAIEALTRYLAVELAPRGITVNAVSGGTVDTDALEHFPRREAILDASRTRTPAGRLLTPLDLAHAVGFLCSDEAAMICGQTIVVDGGYSLLG